MIGIRQHFIQYAEPTALKGEKKQHFREELITDTLPRLALSFALLIISSS